MLAEGKKNVGGRINYEDSDGLTEVEIESEV